MIEFSRLASRGRAAFRRPTAGARLVGVGTATPPRRYTQTEVLDRFGEQDARIRRIYTHSHIDARHLYLPEPVGGAMPEESSQQLIDKHLRGSLEIGAQAIEACLDPLDLAPADVDFLCCVSSTGFLCPGISAHLVKELGFREDVRRLDILGMGCNAALNGLQATTSFASSQPGKLGLMLCVEICSAAYVYNRKMTTAVVNSLFGDGAAAALLRDDSADHDRLADGADGAPAGNAETAGLEMSAAGPAGPLFLDFEPHIIPEALPAMRYELDGGKLSFYLDRDIPYVIGMNVEKPVRRLLKRHRLKLRDVDHWLIHSGGKKVVNAIEYNLGLSDHDVRHTLHVLKNYGNLSSGSILFSYQQLCREGVVREGDLGVAIAMGPGTSIETALLAW